MEDPARSRVAVIIIRPSGVLEEPQVTRGRQENRHLGRNGGLSAVPRVSVVWLLVKHNTTFVQHKKTRAK